MRSVEVRSAMEIPVGIEDAMNQSAAPDWMGGGTNMSMN
jgi:hypothetical protein